MFLFLVWENVGGKSGLWTQRGKGKFWLVDLKKYVQNCRQSWVIRQRVGNRLPRIRWSRLELTELLIKDGDLRNSQSAVVGSGNESGCSHCMFCAGGYKPVLIDWWRRHESVHAVVGRKSGYGTVKGNSPGSWQTRTFSWNLNTLEWKSSFVDCMSVWVCPDACYWCRTSTRPSTWPTPTSRSSPR